MAKLGRQLYAPEEKSSRVWEIESQAAIDNSHPIIVEDVLRRKRPGNLFQRQPDERYCMIVLVHGLGATCADMRVIKE